MRRSMTGWPRRTKTPWRPAAGRGLTARPTKKSILPKGVQSWFHCNRCGTHEHNDVGTRAEVKAYDPELARLIAEVFGDRPWVYATPQSRPRRRTWPGSIARRRPDSVGRRIFPNCQTASGGKRRQSEFVLR